MSAARRPRRFGAVNWRGLMTLALKDIRRTIKSYRYTFLGPVISNLLFLAVFQLALGDGAARVGALDFLQFLAPGLMAFALGLAVGGRAFAGVWAAVAALAFLALLAALSACIGFLVAWLLRDGEYLARRRRRGRRLRIIAGATVRDRTDPT